MNRITSFHVAPFVLLLGAALLGACDEDQGSIPVRKGSTGPGGSGSGSSGSGGPSAAEQLFRGLEGDLVKTCGGTGGVCHVTGAYPGNPPSFLAGPDAYVSIRSFPSIVVRDPSQSALLNKTQHEGPGLTPGSDLKKNCEAWIGAEALEITSKKLPTTAPVSITNGANDVDLSSAASANVGSVHLRFDASLIGGILSIANMRLVTPPGAAVHLYKPRFVRISAGREAVDPADTFSNTDQTVPGGAETKLTPGFALFSGATWTPFVLAADQVRIEIEKLEPGTISVIEAPMVCKNPTQFGTTVLPVIRNTMAANGTCNSCHANTTAPQIGGADNAAICINILQRLNAANIPQSKMITKVTMAGHPGGLVADPTAWTALFVNNKAVFF